MWRTIIIWFDRLETLIALIQQQRKANTLLSDFLVLFHRLLRCFDQLEEPSPAVVITTTSLVSNDGVSSWLVVQLVKKYYKNTILNIGQCFR